MSSGAPSSSLAHKYANHCNTTYASSYKSDLDKLGTLQKPAVGPAPTAHIAIITCMDARLDPERMFGLSLGEAHVIRVGGGRAPDALRSLVCSEQLLETREVMVVHHTDCGFTHAESTDGAYAKIRAGLGKEGGGQREGGRMTVESVPLMLILRGVEESVKDDVGFLKASPYVKKDAVVTGWVYDTFSGQMKLVC